MRWSALVELKYETPCQVSLQIKNPRLEGQGDYGSLLMGLLFNDYQLICMIKNSLMHFKRGFKSIRVIGWYHINDENIT